MLERVVVVDTGAIVAALDRGELNHGWAYDNFRSLPKPFITCEAVMNEVCYLMRASRNGEQDALYLIESGVLKLDFSLSLEVSNIMALMKKYENVPMSLADACLVRISELNSQPAVFTLDSDFTIYRRHLNARIPLIIPSGVA